MSEIVALRAVGLGHQSPVLTLTLSSGQTVAIVGPAGSGKSRLLRILGGRDAPPSGEVKIETTVGWPTPVAEKRHTPQQLARVSGPGSQASRATDALTATRLWEQRQTPVAELSPGQQLACELLPLLSHDDGLICLDGYLDHLDPWALQNTRDLLRKRLAAGAAMAIVTHRPDLVEQCDFVVAVNNGQVVHAGRVQDLLKRAPHEMEVVTERQQAVRALVKPFEIHITEQKRSMVVKAEEGQSLAAKLLLEGYGDIRYIIHRQPTLEECLLGLI